eukprot:COSAG02_NODE_499_length_21072_cov_6.490011_7_plen_90_part_00
MCVNEFVNSIGDFCSPELSLVRGPCVPSRAPSAMMAPGGIRPQVSTAAYLVRTGFLPDVCVRSYYFARAPTHLKGKARCELGGEAGFGA